MVMYGKIHNMKERKMQIKSIRMYKKIKMGGIQK